MEANYKKLLVHAFMVQIRTVRLQQYNLLETLFRSRLLNDVVLKRLWLFIKINIESIIIILNKSMLKPVR
jgi:hypothetical protein